MAGVIDFDAPSVNRTAEEVLKPAIEEMKRRASVAKDFDPNTVQEFPLTGTAASCDPQLEEQRFALVTVGTRVMAPRPVNPRYPSLRVYGCFQDREEAVEHSVVVREKDPDCSLLVLKVGEWFLFPQSESVLGSAEEAGRRLDEKLKAHGEWRLRQCRAFDDAIQDNKDRPVNWDRTDWSEDRQEEAEAMDSVYKRPKRLRAGAEVRGQTHCAMSVIPDASEDGEVLIKILGCFEGLKEAEGWVQDVGSRNDAEHDIYIATTCDWLYPNGDYNRSRKDMYRIGELQKIMDAATVNPKNVQNFKDWKKKADLARVDADASRGAVAECVEGCGADASRGAVAECGAEPR